MKRLSTLVGVVVLLAGVELTSTAIAGDKDKLNNSPFFPLKVGTKWEYQSSGKKITVEVKAHETVGGVLCARLETDSGGVTLTEHLTVKDDGIYRVQANGQKIEPMFLVLKLPPKDGESWKNNSTAQGFKIEADMTIKEEKKLKVLGKEFDTFKVTAPNMKVGGQDAQMTSWFDKDVGMVQQTFVLPGAGVDVKLELEKFTAGK
jgi:hypothetical protein